MGLDYQSGIIFCRLSQHPPQQNQIKNIGPIRDIENLPVLFFRLPYKIKVKNSGSFLSKRNTFF